MVLAPHIGVDGGQVGPQQVLDQLAPGRVSAELQPLPQVGRNEGRGAANLGPDHLGQPEVLLVIIVLPVVAGSRHSVQVDGFRHSQLKFLIQI